MNFVRPIRDSQGANRSKQFGQRKICRDAGASVYLNGLVDNSQSDIWHGDLDLRDFAAGSFGANFIEHPCSLQSQQPSLLDHDSSIGNDIDVTTEFRERFSERYPLQRTAAQEFKRAFSRSQRAHAVVNAPRTKPPLRDFETSARSPNNMVERNSNAREADSAVSERGVVGTKHRHHPLDLDPRSIDRHQHHRMTLVLGGGLIG